ncbi:hypothetical protein [Kitasatospora sp. NPDC088351]|uniref:hypothetical protein n=1 Tax=unclassified Kitasatospora TaxID=2633591 RepID=UPI00342C16B8
MARAFLILALIVMMATSFRYHRTPRHENDPDKIWCARVGDRRSVEVWRRGLTIDVRVVDRH